MSLNVLPSPKAATELSIDLFEAGVQMSPLVFPLLPQKYIHGGQTPRPFLYFSCIPSIDKWYPFHTLV